MIVAPHWVVKYLDRNVNQRLVFESIWRYGPITRNQLSELTGLAIPTVSRITSEQLEVRLINEVAQIESTGGRRPTLLAINPDCAYLIGVDLGATKIAALATNLDSQVLAKRHSLLAETREEYLLDLVATHIEELITASGAARDHFVGVGIGVPGSIDADQGMVIEASNLAVRQWRLRDELSSAVGLPVYIENDANVAALGELFFGVGQLKRNLGFINVGTGIGLGLILDEAVFKGDLGQAGEFGHMILAKDGPRCTCGNQGCLEALAGGWAIAQRYADSRGFSTREATIAPGGGLSIVTEDVFRLADEGDATAQQIIAEAVEYLGMGIANLVDVLSLRLVVLGGGLIQAHPSLVTLVREAMERYLIAEHRGHVKLSRSKLGQDAGALGGAALVLQHAFSARREKG